MWLTFDTVEAIRRSKRNDCQREMHVSQTLTDGRTDGWTDWLRTVVAFVTKCKVGAMCAKRGVRSDAEAADKRPPRRSRDDGQRSFILCCSNKDMKNMMWRSYQVRRCSNEQCFIVKSESPPGGRTPRIRLTLEDAKVESNPNPTISAMHVVSWTNVVLLPC